MSLGPFKGWFTGGIQKEIGVGRMEWDILATPIAQRATTSDA